MSDLIKISQEVKSYKKEIGYKTPAEAERLDQESFADHNRLLELKKNSPTLKRLEEEGAEAQAKLAQAVIDKDDAAKNKWGPIVGENSKKKIDALESIPEIVALQNEIDAKTAKIEQLNYDELAKTPKGKELADKQRMITEGFTNR